MYAAHAGVGAEAEMAESVFFRTAQGLAPGVAFADHAVFGRR